jgi:DNA polymerase III subunit alpha
MSDPKFIHLHVHTAYSLSEGALPIKKLAGMAKAFKMPALAATDTSNLFGALEFSEALVEKAIQPIIGLRLRVDFSLVSESIKATQTGLKHHTTIVLLAKDEAGYKNLLKLSSSSFLEAPENSEPHVIWAKLEACAEGLICSATGVATERTFWRPPLY